MKKKTKKRLHTIVSISIAIILIGSIALPIILSLFAL
jgi:hypothetical protein